MEEIVLISAAYSLICGLLAGFIAARRRGNGIPFFFVGFFLGLIGVIIALVVPGKNRPPKGWHAVECPRCNAEQNAQRFQPEFTCWQCGDEVPLEWA